jgi:hypothetical protein
MKFVGIALLVFTATMATADETRYDLSKTPELFEKFIKDFGRKYKDDADRQIHYEAFAKTLKIMNKQNEENPLATFAINKFSDYTESELQKIKGFRP